LIFLIVGNGLGEIIEFTENSNIQEMYSKETIINYVDIDAIDNINFRIKEVKQKTVEELSSRARRILKKGYIFYSMVRPYLKNIAIIEEERERFIGTTGASVFRVYNLETKYIFRVLLSPYINNNHLELLKGFNSPSITQEQFVNTLIPLPPLEEQKRIVKKLDNLKKLIESLKEKVKSRDKTRQDLKKSIMSEIEKSDSNKDLLESLEMIFKNFDIVVKEKEDIKDIRDLILSMAVKGKLVEQNSDDEPASVLLEKIKEEKERLIKEKKIKKPKKLEAIKEEEIPFDIPDSWEWVVSELNPRNSIEDEVETSFIPMKLIEDGYSNSHSFEIKKWKEIKSGFTHFAENDVVVAKITPCFQNRKSAVMKKLKNGVGSGTTELYVIRSYANLLLSEYILNIVKSNMFIEGGVGTYTGTAGQQRVQKDFIQNHLVALPPLEEQKRIVEKVDKLMNLCDELEKKVEKSKTESEILMKSVLQGVFEK